MSFDFLIFFYCIFFCKKNFTFFDEIVYLTYVEKQFHNFNITLEDVFFLKFKLEFNFISQGGVTKSNVIIKI